MKPLNVIAFMSGFIFFLGLYIVLHMTLFPIDSETFTLVSGSLLIVLSIYGLFYVFFYSEPFKW